VRVIRGEEVKGLGDLRCEDVEEGVGGFGGFGLVEGEVVEVVREEDRGGGLELVGVREEDC